MQGRTQATGARTNRHGRHTRHSPLTIAGKDPAYDYSFRRSVDIEQGGGQDMLGYVPAEGDETWAGPKMLQPRTGSHKGIRYLDTILCKRELEVAEYYNEFDIEKREMQIDFVNSVGGRVQRALRAIDPKATVRDDSSGIDQFSQKTGPTEATVPVHAPSPITIHADGVSEG